MIHLLYQYFYVDIYLPVWPNVAASAILGAPVFWWHHSRMVKHLEAHHAKLVKLLTPVVQDVEQAIDKAQHKP